jgi:hypothetical protein
MGTLVLQNYTPGDELETSNFVSFTYSSNLLSFTSDDGSLFGVLPVNLPAPANVDIEELVVVPGCTNCAQLGFQSSTLDNDQWQVFTEDIGTNGIWSAAAPNTAVPEPSSLVMLAGGLAGLGAWRLRLRGFQG